MPSPSRRSDAEAEVQDYLARVRAGQAGQNPVDQTLARSTRNPAAVRIGQQNIADRTNENFREIDRAAREQEALEADQAREAEAAAKDAAKAQEAARNQALDSAEKAGVVVEEGIDGTRDVARHADGTAKWTPGNIGGPEVIGQARTAIQNEDGTARTMPNTDIMLGQGGVGNIGETGIPSGTESQAVFGQAKRDDRGNVTVAPVETKTDPKSGKMTVASKDAEGKAVKLPAGVDWAVRERAARQQATDEELAAVDLRSNELAQQRLAFEPQFAPAKKERDEAQAELARLGQPHFQKGGAWYAITASGSERLASPDEVQRAKTLRQQAQARLDRAEAAYRPLEGQAATLDTEERQIKARKLQLEADKIRLANGLPMDDGGLAKLLTVSEKRGADPEMEAVAAVIPDENTPPEQMGPPKPVNQTPDDLALFRGAFSAFNEAEKLSLGGAGANYRMIRRNGVDIGSVERDRQSGVPVVVIGKNANATADLRGLVAFGATTGIPLYAADSPKRKTLTQEAAWVAGAFDAASPTPEQIEAYGETKNWPEGTVEQIAERLRAIGATPEGIARQVRAGELSVQHGEALMRDLYGSTLKADDPLDPATQAAWLEENPDQKAAFLSSLAAEKNAAAQSFLSDWWASNMGKPGVTWRAREAASKALAQKSRLGEKAAAVGGGLVDAAGSMIGMLSAPTSMAYLTVMSGVAGQNDDTYDKALLDAWTNYGRASKNTWRGWEGNRKKWFTPEGKKLFKDFETSGAELRALIPTMDLYAEGIDDPKWKTQYSAAVRKVTDAAFALHNSNSEAGWRMTRADLDPSANPELAKLVNGAVMTGDTGLLDLYFESLLQDHGTRQAAQYLDELTAGAGRFRSAVIAGSAAPPEEIGIEMLSTALTWGVGKVAFGGVKAAAATERAAAAIGTASRMSRFRAAAHGLKADFAALGMKTGTAQAPLTRLDKASNLLVGTLKTGAGNSITEAGEEAAMALSEPGATRQSVMEGAGMGALAGFLLGPVIGGPAALKDAAAKDRKRREASANFAAEYNRIAAGTPGFIPMTPDRAETASLLIDPARRDAALTEAREAAGFLAAAIGAAKEESATPAALDQFARAQQRMAAATDALIDATIDPVEAVNAIQSVPEADRPLVMAALKIAARRPDSLTPEEAKAAGSRRTAAGESYFAGNDLSPAGRQSLAQAFPALSGFLGRSAAVPITTPTPATNGQDVQGQTVSPARTQAPSPQPPVQVPPVSTGTAGQAGTQPARAAGATPQVVPANVEAAVYEAARGQDATLPDVTTAVTNAFNAGQPVSVSMARAANVEIPEGYTRTGNTWTPPATAAAPAPAPQATPAKTNQTQAVAKRVVERFPALKGIVEIDKKGAQGSGGVYVASGKIIINPQDLEADLAGYPTEQAKQARIDAIIEEEIVHVAQIRAALATGKSVESVYSAIWKDFTLAQQKAAAEAYQGNFTSLDDWQKGAETVRMLVQLRMSGTQTELSKAFSTSVPQSLIDLLKNAVAILREFLAAGEVPASVQRAIDATEAMLAEMTAVEATAQETTQPTTQETGLRIQTTGDTAAILEGDTVLWNGPSNRAEAELASLQAAMDGPLRISGEAINQAAERYNLDAATKRELDFATEDLADIMEGLPPDQRRPFIEQAIEEWVAALGIAKKQAEDQAEASKDAERRARSKAAREAAKSRLRDKARAILNSDTYPALSAIFQRGRITPKPNAVGLIISRKKAGKKLTEKEMGIIRNLSDFDGMPRKQDFTGGGNNVLAREILDLLYARQGEGQMPNVIADKLTPSIDTASEMFEAIGRELNALANGKQMVDRLDDPNHEWTDEEIAEFEARREAQAAQEETEAAPEPQPYATASDIHGFAVEAFGPEAEFTEKLGAIADFADRFPRDVMPLIREIIGIEFARHVDGLSIPEWTAQNGGEFTADGKFFLTFLRTNTAAEVRAKLGQMPVMDEIAPLASSPTVAPFYSQLARTLEEKMPKTAPVAQVVQIAASGAKAEEIKWSGLIQGAQALAVDGKVEKAALMKYLGEEGSVRFEEVTFGGDKMVFRSSFPTREALMANIDGDEGVQKPNGELKPGLRIVQTEEGWNLADSKDGNDSKFSQYVLPGGENYREVVLAMPERLQRADERNWKVQYDKLSDRARMLFEERGKQVPDGGYRVYDGDSKEPISSAFRQTEDEALTLARDIAPKLAAIGTTYTSNHFPDVPNYVAHMRLNERQDAEGKPGLFIEELQSDRHQAGREKGYKGDKEIPEGYTLIDETQAARDAGFSVPDGYPTKWRYEGPGIYSEIFDSREDAIKSMWRRSGAEGVADAPFRNTWPLALFKRALRDAVASGKDWIGWTVGETQNDRFDLSKTLESVDVAREGDKFRVFYRTREGASSEAGAFPAQELPDVVGKELADKIVSDFSGGDPARKEALKSQMDQARRDMQAYGFDDPKGEEAYDRYKTLQAEYQASNPTAKKYEGLDLKVGGSGMKGFYDNILPKEIGKYVKQWGASVEKATIGAPKQGTGKLTKEELSQVRKDVRRMIQGDISTEEFNDEWGTSILEEDVPSADPSRMTQFVNMFVNVARRQRELDAGGVFPAWRITITPAMKAGVSQGQALFSSPTAQPAFDFNQTTDAGDATQRGFNFNEPKTQASQVKELQIPVPSYFADRPGNYSLWDIDEEIQRAKQVAQLQLPISDKPDRGGEAFTPEMLMYEVLNAEEAASSMNGQLVSGRSRGASQRDLVASWVRANQLRNLIAVSKAQSPAMWNDYEARQAALAALPEGSEVHTPWASPPEFPRGTKGVIVKKFKKNWRINHGYDSLVRPEALRPFRESSLDIEPLTPGSMEKFVTNTTNAYQKAPEGKPKQGIAIIAAKKEGMTNPGKVTATPQRMLDFGITGSMGTKDQPGLFSSPTPNQRAFDFGTDASFNTRNQMGFDFGTNQQTRNRTPEPQELTQPQENPSVTADTNPDTINPKDRNQFPGTDYPVPPNVVFIQPRGLDTNPLTDRVWTFPYNGTAEDAAKVAAKAFTDLAGRFDDMSQRESIFGASGPDGMTKFRLTMSRINDQVTVTEVGRQQQTRPPTATSTRGKSAVQNLWDWASDATASIDPRAPQGNLFDTTPKTSNTQTNDIPSRPNLEPDRPGASAPNQGGDAGIQNDRPATGATRRPLDEAGKAGEDAGGGGAMPPDMPATDGGGTGDAKPRGQKSQPAKRNPGDQQPGGSGQPDGGGLEPQRPGPEDTRPNLIPATTGIESLAPSGVESAVTPRFDGWVSPLTPEQKGDVVFVEARLYGANKSGVLLTNGTGTGKTFSGLGVIKQALDRGAQHILVVAPSDGVGMAWKRAANNFFDIPDAAQLADTKDNGKGNRLVFATYANLGQNNTLIERPWDLIVADEAHYLSQAKEGKTTNALDAVRALTWHKSGMWDRAAMLHPEEKQVLEDGEKIPFRERSPYLKNRMADASGIIDNTRRRLAEEQKQRITEQDRPRLMMLSATPFAYHFSLDYAEGYLFDHGPEPTSTAYNTPSARDRFYIENFGYRMRTGKLTQPDAAAATATGILERRFAEKLMKDKAMSGRALQVDQDYSRQFVLTETEVGRQIDQIIKAMRDNPEFAVLNDYIALGDYLARRYLFEGIKAREAVARVKQHLALGRKVVVFHDYKKGGAFNPLIPVFHRGEIIEKWNQETGKNERINLRVVFEKLKRSVPFYDQAVKELNGLLSPIDVFTRNFPEGGIYNGSVPKARRRAIVEEFNTSGSMMNVILVQRASGKEGISLHDTDRRHQRAFIDIGFASRPTDAIQGEGRIYRHGVQSDAVVEYLTTGTDAERMTFAETIARRSSTAENLAMGERARTLLQSFASGYNDAEAIEPSLSQGKGGKEMDRAMEAGTSYKTAVALFYTNQKKTSRNKSSEGTDYFATPEPVGFKMVEWADIQQGERVLEPSGGHGAIARFFPDSTDRHAVEPSMELAGRLALNATDTTIHNQRFEDFNIIRKFNAVVMNPPFGTAGKTAMDHLVKALGHLRNGGRVVALIPEGTSMQKRFDKWYESKEADPYFIRAEIKLPTSTFERAGTSVSTRILVIDKLVTPRGREAQNLDSIRRDLSNAESFEEFIERLEFVNVPPRPEVTPEVEEATEAAEPNIMTGGRDFILPSVPRPEVETTFSTAEFPHSKTGATMFVAKLEARLSKDEYAKVAASAKAFGGWYSSYAKDGAIPGFLFKSAEARDVFVGGASGQSDTAPPTLYSSPTPQQPDLFTAATAPDAGQKLGDVKVGRMNALAAYRALTKKRNAGNTLTADEEQKLLDAEQSLGQKLAFDMDGLATQGSSKLPPRTDNIFDDILGMIRPMKFDNEATRRVKNIIWRAIDMATQAPAERAKLKAQFARTIQKGKGVEVFDKGQLETLLEEQFAYDTYLLKAAWDMEAAAVDKESLTTQPVALQGPMTPKRPQATIDDGGGIFGADRSFLQTKDGQMGLFSSATPMPIPPPSTAFERAAIRVSEITGSKSGTRQNEKFTEFFDEELAKDEAYEEALAKWVGAIPENKPITFIRTRRDNELPNYYTVTKNASDPERPWRTTYFNTQRRPDWTIEEEIEYEELFKKTRWYSNSPEWNKWNDRLYELGSRPTTTSQTRIVPAGHEEAKTRMDAVKHALSMAGNMDAKIGALFSSPTPEVSDAIQQALEQMPTKYRQVFEDIQSGMPPLDVIAKHKISEKGLTNILNQVRARLATATAAATSGLNPVMRGDKILGGRPDLALSIVPEIAAVDQMRNESTIPDVRPWDAVFAQAAEMLATDYQGTYDMLLAKARDLQPMTDMEVAASKMIISRETMAGKITEPADRVKLGMMIYGYREIGTETARSLAIRRDPHLTPAERHAQFIAEALFTPDTATRNRMKKNPRNAENILAGWMKRVDTIEAELRAQGIDIRASLAEFNARKESVNEASAENPQTKAIIDETFRRLTRREKAVIEAIRSGALATKAAFLTGMSVQEVLEINGQFVKDIKAAMSEAAKRFLAQSLASSPSNNAMDSILAELGIYDNSLIDDTQPDFVDRRNEKPRAPRKRRAPKETPADGTATAPATPKAPKKPAAPFVPNLTPEQQAALDEAWKRWIDSPLSPWKAFQDEMGILYWTQKQADEFMAKAEGIKRDWTKMKDLFEEREKINETTGTFDTEATNTEGTLFPQPVNETTGTFDLNDPLAMKQVIDAFALARGTKMDALMEFWRMSILTGPQTHVVNTASNLMNLAFNLIPRRAAEASINGVLGLVGQSDPTSATFREFGPMLANLRAGASLAARNGLRAWKMESRGLFESYAQAQALQMEFSGVGTEYIPPALGGKLGRIMRSLSFRAMTAADEFMKSIYGQMEAAAHAHRIAREEEKLTGDAYGERIAQLMIPGSTAWIRAVDGSRRVTFQEEMDGSDPAAIRRIDQLAELVKKGRVMPWLGRPITFLIPFVDTPTNIFKQALQYTPIGGGLALIDMARALRRRIASNGLTPEEARAEAAQLYDRARLVQDMTNQAIGLMVWMALDGLVGGEDDEELPFITGTIPFKSTRKGERDNAFAVMPAMSIRIGGLQFSYSRFEPFATVLAGMADLRVEMNRRGGFKPEVVSEFLMRFKDQINEKTFLQGVSNLLNAIEDPDRFAERLAANVATGFIPNFIRQPIREVTGTLPDTNPRADDGFFTAVAKRVGYSIVPQAAPERLSAWGEEIPTNRGEMIGGNRGTDAAFRIFDPTNATLNPDIDPIDRWIYQWNLQTADSKDRVAIEPIGNSITGKVPGEKRAQQFPLTVEEQAEANRNAGRMARAMLGQDWQGRELTEESAKAIKDVVSQAQDFERRRLRQIKIAQAMANPE